MSFTVIIPARLASTRLPNKPIADICGKPMIGYSIGAANRSGIFDEVMVSTDSDEIRRIAEVCGAKVPFMRSPATSGDMAATHEVVTEVLQE